MARGSWVQMALIGIVDSIVIPATWVARWLPNRRTKRNLLVGHAWNLRFQLRPYRREGVDGTGAKS